MRYRGSIGAVALAAMLGMAATQALAFDDAKYPDWKGQWLRAPQPGAPGGNPPYDPARPPGRGQQAPLTAEYQALFEANLVDQAAGGAGFTRGVNCHSLGMPGIMTLFVPMEIVIQPDTTYILIDRYNTQRRIYTDGRDWPAEPEPAYVGYSIGRWIDDGGTGRFNALEVETRAFKGPRWYEASGIPLHRDSATIIRERLSSDKTNPNAMHDEITVIDHALTRPWTVTKNYRRDPSPRPVWLEDICDQDRSWVEIDHQDYMLSADGLLMPAKKDQPPPSLKYFTQTRN